MRTLVRLAFSLKCWIIGSLSRDEKDVNENGIKAIGLDWQNNDSARTSPFNYCTFLCRHCKTMTWKCLISRFVEKVGTTETTTLFFFSWTSVQSFRIQRKKSCQHLRNCTRWNKLDKVVVYKRLAGPQARCHCNNIFLIILFHYWAFWSGIVKLTTWNWT